MSDYVDPFADDEPADEAQTQSTTSSDTENPREDAPVANNNTATPVVVNASSDGKVVVTLKGGKEFDKPWVVIHALDVDDALAQLRHNKIQELLKVTQSAAGYFAKNGSGNSSAAPQQQGGGQSAAPAGKPQGATETPADVDPRFCKHGEMVYRTGFSEAKQKTWKGFFCPTAKGTPDQCKAQFLR